MSGCELCSRYGVASSGCPNCDSVRPDDYPGYEPPDPHPRCVVCRHGCGWHRGGSCDVDGCVCTGYADTKAVA